VQPAWDSPHDPWPNEAHAASATPRIERATGHKSRHDLVTLVAAACVQTQADGQLTLLAGGAAGRCPQDCLQFVCGLRVRASVSSARAAAGEHPGRQCTSREERGEQQLSSRAASPARAVPTVVRAVVATIQYRRRPSVRLWSIGRSICTLIAVRNVLCMVVTRLVGVVSALSS
jgi:hypothetical protein